METSGDKKDELKWFQYTIQHEQETLDRDWHRISFNFIWPKHCLGLEFLLVLTHWNTLTKSLIIRQILFKFKPSSFLNGTFFLKYYFIFERQGHLRWVFSMVFCPSWWLARTIVDRILWLGPWLGTWMLRDFAQSATGGRETERVLKVERAMKREQIGKGREFTAANGLPLTSTFAKGRSDGKITLKGQRSITTSTKLSLRLLACLQGFHFPPTAINISVK